MAKKRFSLKPKMPKKSASLADWQKYKKDMEIYEKEKQQKEILINEIKQRKR